MRRDGDVHLTGDDVPERELREVTADLQPVAGGGKARRDRASTVVAIAVVVVGLAIIKPWGGSAPAATEPVAAPPARDTAGPVSVASAAPQQPVLTDPNAMSCLTHQTEQVITLERWPDREIKSWSLALGAGPAFPTEDTAAVRMASSRIVGIGICPGTGPGSTPAVFGNEPSGSGGGGATGSLTWTGASITDVQASAGAIYADLGAPPRITSQFDYVAAGVLFGAPVPGGAVAEASPAAPATLEPAAVLRPWPAGRYALQYSFPGDPTGAVRWVVVEIRTPTNGN